MSRYFHDPGELHELVARLCDENLDAAGRARLNEILVSDPAAQAWYIEYVDLHAAIRQKMLTLDDEDFSLQEVQAALNAVAPTYDVAESCARLASNEVSKHTAPVDQFNPRSSRNRFSTSSKLMLWSTAAAAALVIIFASRPRLDSTNVAGKAPDASQAASAPASSDASMAGPAKLSGAVGARWAGADLELPEGQVFDENQRLELIEGLAELTFRSGARVIAQGPAVVQIEGDASAHISVGRVAVVTAPAARRFTIVTAAARLTSDESEFGADIDADGSLVTEVYHGRVELQFTRGAAEPTTVQLASGQGARIDARRRRVTPLAQPYDLHFVRYLPQHDLLVNLADVVAGGNGLRKAYHEGISLVDGRKVDDYGAPAQGDGRFIRAPSFNFVDGVFIPNGKLGPVQVDSIGRTFSEFGPTSGDCWGGAIMARRPSEEKSLPFIRLEFHGDNYGYVNWLHIASKADELSPEGYGLIGMHSNCGITFDLHAIRARHPAKKIVRFRARVGNLESKAERYVADAWVLVDGELKYRRAQFSREDGLAAIDIPLTGRDRFLVLAVTDVQANTAYDWVAFGDPMIELASNVESSADGRRREAKSMAATDVMASNRTAPRASENPRARIAHVAMSDFGALSAISQYSTRLIGWQLVTSIGNHVERTQ